MLTENVVVAEARPEIIDLPYEPRPHNAVSCNEHSIFVAQRWPAAVHIHSWAGGEHLQTITPPQLGLQKDDRINAVLWREKIHSLLLVTAPDTSSATAKTMHAYTVSGINVHADHILCHISPTKHQIIQLA